jgi:hypothetical protein
MKHWTSLTGFRAALRVLHGLCLAGLFSVVVPQLGLAAELVMFETRACPWCAAWHRDVGGIYHKTTESRAAPLRRVDMDGPRPDDLAAVRPVVYSPTFVLLDEGREIGRIQGYPGADHFWGLLGVLLEKLGQPRTL